MELSKSNLEPTKNQKIVFEMEDEFKNLQSEYRQKGIFIKEIDEKFREFSDFIGAIIGERNYDTDDITLKKLRDALNDLVLLVKKIKS